MADVAPGNDYRAPAASITILRRFRWVEGYPGELPPQTVYINRSATYTGTLHGLIQVNSDHWSCSAGACGSFSGSTLTTADKSATPSLATNTDVTNTIATTTLVGAQQTYTVPNNGRAYLLDVPFQVTVTASAGASAGGINRAEADGDISMTISSITVTP